MQRPRVSTGIPATTVGQVDPRAHHSAMCTAGAHHLQSLQARHTTSSRQGGTQSWSSTTGGNPLHANFPVITMMVKAPVDALNLLSMCSTVHDSQSAMHTGQLSMCLTRPDTTTCP